jgi:hypothetical protein
MSDVYSYEELEKYIASGWIPTSMKDEYIMALINKSEPMKVEPETPVKPDKIVIPTEQKMLTVVELKIVNETMFHYLTYESCTEDKNGLFFNLASRYDSLVVARKKYWFEVYPDCAGPVSYYHPYIVMHYPMWVPVADKEDVMEARERWTNPPVRRPKLTPGYFIN